VLSLVSFFIQSYSLEEVHQKLLSAWTVSRASLSSRCGWRLDLYRMGWVMMACLHDIANAVPV
jgi:hypothetical protein